ncbi:MAG: histidine kinase [Balneolia bacterium]|nr:histidine kinase [Balneolia bacterium]
MRFFIEYTKEVLGTVIFYLFFSFLYHAVIQYVSLDSAQGDFWSPLFSLENYWYAAGMQYLFFFIGSLIIWFAAFRLLGDVNIIYRIVAVVIMIPGVVYVVRFLRYAIVDFYELGRLQGAGTIWDLYIPYLFLMFQFGCFFAYSYFSESQKQLRMENELRQATLKSELAALKAQINPHFLYNVFNTINATIPPELESTRKMTADLSDMFRYQLRASKSDFVSLADEIDFVKKYLHLEKARFEERLEFRIDVDDSLMGYRIPPMILQPLVENALKHGLSSLVEGGKIEISVTKSDDELHFSISDNGAGIMDMSDIMNSGTGLRNTKLRIEKIYGNLLHVEENEPRGVKISFAIPCTK